jgi:hypothetical protein
VPYPMLYTLRIPGFRAGSRPEVFRFFVFALSDRICDRVSGAPRLCRFTSEVLGNYLRTSNFSSFVRQLNYYGKAAVVAEWATAILSGPFC